MRTWGRILVFDPETDLPVIDPRTGAQQLQWVKVETAADGNNSLVWLTTLIQVLKLNLNESPFFANYGIPAHPSVVQQVAPDFYATLTQQYFAPYFAALTIAKVLDLPPTYKVNATTVEGTKFEATIAT